MPAYSGKFQYGGVQGACKLSFDQETCVVTPAAGAPLAFDLGDVERTARAEWDLELTLYTGKKLQLRQFGSLFGRMAGELIAAWRDRTVQCLLLEDLEEVMRCPGAVNGAAAEIRLYRTNLAVLPDAGTPFQLRLAEVDSVAFDQGSYSIVLETSGGRVALGKLARKTDEMHAKLRECWDGLRTRSAQALLDRFPFLPPDALQRVTAIMPEGRSVRLSALAAIDPKLPGALITQAVDRGLKPYFDALLEMSDRNGLMAGYKFIRQEEQPQAEAEEPPEGETGETGEEEEQPEKPPLFFWFFFPLRNNVMAWEASTGTGRATYFFRPTPPADFETAVARITRGLALVNFRREPVYLSDAALERQPRFRRYIIGARKLSDLRALRAAMLGRAIHSTPEAWSEQVRALAK
ncbi:MAG: hypothetical protein ACE15B_16250 [Bryobacteraceae bacterium]